MAGVWGPEIVEQLRSFAAQGYSASQAASQFEGMTRNAAVGLAFRKKFHFLGTGGGSNHKSAKTPKDPTIRVPRRTYLKRAAEPVQEVHRPKGITLMELTERSCRWPLGDPHEPGFLFCGTDKHEEHPYCAPHCCLAYESPENRNADLQREAGQSAGARNQIRHWRTFPSGF